MNRRQFLTLAGGATAALVLPKTLIAYPKWMAEETPAIVPAHFILPNYRCLERVEGYGYALESLPNMVAVARGLPNGQINSFLQWGLQAMGGYFRWTAGIGDEPIDIAGYPLRIASSSPLVKWIATYRNQDNSRDVIEGAGYEITHRHFLPSGVRINFDHGMESLEYDS